ncbi:MAG TPA: 30S ribosomal protein S8 [Candidatus Paceibacterota bacterium]|nr:30S ribosomal protein S8 [Candidatus Paceibacterota bacterium]
MDPISNMIVMIKNASLARKESVSMPYSKLKHAIANCLHKEGYIGAIDKKAKKGHPSLEIELLYGEDNKPKVCDIERISKQSKRVYFGTKDIHVVRGGRGLLVLSTPKGILGGKEARKEQVGGEALFKVW